MNQAIDAKNKAYDQTENEIKKLKDKIAVKAELLESAKAEKVSADKTVADAEKVLADAETEKADTCICTECRNPMH